MVVAKANEFQGGKYRRDRIENTILDRCKHEFFLTRLFLATLDGSLFWFTQEERDHVHGCKTIASLM